MSVIKHTNEQVNPKQAADGKATGSGETPFSPYSDEPFRPGHGQNSYVLSILDPENAQSIPDLHSEPHVIKKTKTYGTVVIDTPVNPGDIVFYYNPQSKFGKVLLGHVTNGGDRIYWERYIGETQDVFKQYFLARAISSKLAIVSDTRSLNTAQLNGSFLATMIFRQFNREPPNVVLNENQEFSKNVSIKKGLALTMIPTGGQDFREEVETTPKSVDAVNTFDHELQANHFFGGTSFTVTLFDSTVGDADDVPEAFDSYEVDLEMVGYSSGGPIDDRFLQVTPYFLKFDGTVEQVVANKASLGVIQVANSWSAKGKLFIPPGDIPYEGFIIQITSPLSSIYSVTSATIRSRTLRANAPGRSAIVLCDKVSEGVTIRLNGFNAFEAIPRKTLAKDLQARSSITMDPTEYANALNYLHETSDVDIRCLSEALSKEDVMMLADSRVINHSLATGSFWGGVTRFFRRAPRIARRVWRDVKPMVRVAPQFLRAAGYAVNPVLGAAASLATGSDTKARYRATGSGRPVKVHNFTKWGSQGPLNGISVPVGRPTPSQVAAYVNWLKERKENRLNEQQAAEFADNVWNDEYWRKPRTEPDEKKTSATGSGRPPTEDSKIWEQELKFLQRVGLKLSACCYTPEEKDSRDQALATIRERCEKLEQRLKALEAFKATGSGRPSDKWARLMDGKASASDFVGMSPQDIAEFTNMLAQQSKLIAEQKMNALKEKSQFGGRTQLDPGRTPEDVVRSEYAAIGKPKFSSSSRGMVAAAAVRVLDGKKSATKTIIYASPNMIGFKEYNQIGSYFVDSDYDVKDATAVIGIINRLTEPKGKATYISFVSEDPIFANTEYAHQSFGVAIALAAAGVVSPSTVTGILSGAPGSVIAPDDLGVKMEMARSADPPMYIGSAGTVEYESSSGLKQVPTASEVSIRGHFPAVTNKGARIVSFASVAGLLSAMRKHADIASIVKSGPIPAAHAKRTSKQLVKLIRKNAAVKYNKDHYDRMLNSILVSTDIETKNKASQVKLHKKLSNLLTTLLKQTSAKKKGSDPSLPPQGVQEIFEAFKRVDPRTFNEAQQGTYEKLKQNYDGKSLPTDSKTINRMVQLVGPMLKKKKKKKKKKKPAPQPAPEMLDLTDDEEAEISQDDPLDYDPDFDEI